MLITNQISDFIKDLEKDGSKVEETDKYVALKNSQNSNDFDISSYFTPNNNLDPFK